MKQRNLNLILLVALSALSIFVIQGCPEKSLKGQPNTLQPPSVYWADVRIDTVYSRNPNLRWFSTDRDGLVIDYQYCVLLASSVDSLGGADVVVGNFPTTAQWSIVHKDSATIPLYASFDTSDYVPQYIFLRAMDDDSLLSDIIYVYMRRNNHPPTCYLILPYKDTNGNGRYDAGEPPDPQWCLPETTASWKGIRVAWVGKDSIDVKGLQPDFEWDIRVYGPFEAQPDSSDTTGDFSRPLSQTWAKAKQAYLTNFPTGWYIMYARNRDDAFVPAKPAIGFMRVYEPRWIRYDDAKPILIANHSWYTTSPLRGGELIPEFRDSVNQFYRGLVEAAGYTTDDYDWVDYTVGNAELEVQKVDLYNHKLVIAIDTDKGRPFVNSPINQEGAYTQYLDVGGMLWIIGRRSFVGGSTAGRVDYGARNSEHPMPYPYLNLSAVFCASPSNYANAEFTGATSLVPGFPDLQVDTLHTMQADWRDPRPPNPTYHYTAVPNVDYLIRLGASEPIYKFVAINPDTSAFHNFPVAIRFDRGTFKTSYFSFPLYFIQQDQAIEVTQRMLEWFFTN